MRLTYMYYLIKKSCDAIESIHFDSVKAKDQRGISTDCIQVSNWTNAKKALHTLKALNCFDDIIDSIINTIGIIRTEKDSFIIDLNDYNKLIKSIQILLQNLNGVIVFCEAAGLDSSKSGFDVKLPQTKDFSELSKYVSTLDRIFSQCPYLNIDGERIEIESVDIGSIWMKFAVITVSTSVILSNLATLVDKCVKIQSHIITCKQQEEQYRTLQLKNDLLESIIQANEEATNILLDQTVEELQKDIGELNSEDTVRLKMSLKELSNMMVKGLEIYASIDAPDEVKAFFPTSDDIKSLNEPIKMLSENIKDNTDN